MTAVTFDISMSLDGFITAPNDRPGEALGDGGQRLHEWVLDTASVPVREVLDEVWTGAGAVVSGGRTFHVCVDEWADKPPAELPWFVISHDTPERRRKAEMAFTFVPDGVESAIDQARSAAGDRYVVVMGGASVGQQCLPAGLIDELQIHVAPVLFGGGIRLSQGQADGRSG